MQKISVIIPARNEEKTIGIVIDKIKESKLPLEIIVIDNCSTDKTLEIAKNKGVNVYYCGNKGKGYAMEEGIRRVNGDIVVFVDADLKIHLEDIISLMVEPIIERKIDFVKSNFYREGGRVTELVAKPLLELLFENQKQFQQPLSGIIAGKTEVFKKITFEKDYGVDVGILLDMLKMNATIEEVYIGKIENNSQSWKFLPKMAKEVANAILKRANYIK